MDNVDRISTSATAVWESFLQSLEGKLSAHVLDAWLRPVRCLAVEGGVACLEVRDQFTRDWLCDHYLELIAEGLEGITGEDGALE